MSYRDEVYINVFNSSFVGRRWVYIRRGYNSIFIEDGREGFRWDNAKRPELEANNPTGTREQALEMAEALCRQNHAPWPLFIMSQVRELL